MKKIITAMVLLISFGVSAQTYIGIGALQNAISLETGHVFNKIDVKVRYDFSLSNTQIGLNRKRYSLSVGKKFTVWAKENEDDLEEFDWSFTPSIGYCYGYEIKDSPVKEEMKYNYFKEKYNKIYFSFEIQRAINWAHRIKITAGASYSNQLCVYGGFKFNLKTKK